MEITQLHYFKTAAKFESFTKAAEELHITQSALSRSIAQLEADIGIQLFERKRGGRITLNKDGVFFLHHVTEVLNTLENTVSAVKEMSGLEQGMVDMAVTEAVFVKNVILDFMREYPDIRLTCRLQSPEQIKQSLDDGTLNFAVCDEQIFGEGLEWHHLFTDYLTVMLPQGHPLRSHSSIRLEELKNEHFIISNIGYDMESKIVQLCQRAGFFPYIVYEGTGEDLCGQLVSEGIGIMITPYSISASLQFLNNALPINGGIPLNEAFASNEIGIVTKKGQFQSKAADALAKRIRDFYQTLPPYTGMR
jgi:LysR family transcriptional regulator, transcription activator of glutamate synthase operon